MFIIYTDGSYKSSRKQGGYSVVICNDKEEILSFHFKGIKYTTNNRMELSGFISALKSIPKGSKVRIVSDSEYVINPITKGWLSKWVDEDFKDRKNPDLWREVVELLPDYEIDFEWTKGHADSRLNNLADMLAQHASDIELDN